AIIAEQREDRAGGDAEAKGVQRDFAGIGLGYLVNLDGCLHARASSSLGVFHRRTTALTCWRPGLVPLLSQSRRRPDPRPRPWRSRGEYARAPDPAAATGTRGLPFRSPPCSRLGLSSARLRLPDRRKLAPPLADWSTIPGQTRDTPSAASPPSKPRLRHGP